MSHLLLNVSLRLSCVVFAAVAPPPHLYAANPPVPYTLARKSSSRRLREAAASHREALQRLASRLILPCPDLQLMQMDSGEPDTLPHSSTCSSLSAELFRIHMNGFCGLSMAKWLFIKKSLQWSPERPSLCPPSREAGGAGHSAAEAAVRETQGADLHPDGADAGPPRGLPGPQAPPLRARRREPHARGAPGNHTASSLRRDFSAALYRPRPQTNIYHLVTLYCETKEQWSCPTVEMHTIELAPDNGAAVSACCLVVSSGEHEALQQEPPGVLRHPHQPLLLRCGARVRRRHHHLLRHGPGPQH